MFFARQLTLAASTVALVSSVSALAFAQVPSTVNPGQIIDQVPRVSPSAPETGIVIEQQGTDVAPKPGSDKKVFTLNAVVLNGSSVYGKDGARETYSPWVGKSVSFADLQTIAQELTSRYRADGYILSRVVLAPQRVKDGTVQFQAIEGYVDQVELQGEIRGDRALLESYIAKIKAEKPLNSATLERYLLLMDDLPGVTARSVLRAAQGPAGASNLVVTLEDDMVEAALQADNRGNKFIGPYQLQAVAAVNSAFGMYERNTLRFVTSSDFEEILYGDYSSEWQLGSEGLRLNTRLAAANTKPGSTLEPLDLEGTTEMIEIGLRYPLLRSREQNLFLSTDFRAQEAANDSAGVELFEDRTRNISAGIDYDVVDGWSGVNQFNATVTKGLDILGSTDDGAGRSRVSGEHDFTKLNLTATRVQGITDSVSLMGSVSGQVASDPLLTSDQFSIGGEGFGRAYDSAELLGDHGVSGILELRYSNTLEDSFIEAYQPYVFYDIGSVWLKQPAVGEEARSSLSSAGIGTRFNLASAYSGYVEFSTPLTRDVGSEGDQGSRVFFSVTKRFTY